MVDTETPSTNHEYIGLPPVLIPVAVKFTLVPEQIAVADAATLTDGINEPVEVIVMPGLAVAVPLIQPLPKPPGINIAVTISPLEGV